MRLVQLLLPLFHPPRFSPLTPTLGSLALKLSTEAMEDNKSAGAGALDQNINP